MDTKDGGPAFPCDLSDGKTPQGATLWDYFAAHAPFKLGDFPSKLGASKEDRLQEIARWNANYADTLIAERTKRFPK